MKYRSIVKCRNCDHSNFNSFFNLGKMELSTFFPEKKFKKKTPIPLNVIICKKCKLFQLQHNYNLTTLFNEDYGYRSGINQSMKNHFNSIIVDINNKIKLNKDDLILDIASNDGTLLGMYNHKNIYKIGIDPTIKKYKKFYKKGIKTSANFFDYNNYKLLSKKKSKIITTIAVFYDIKNPHNFVKDISQILSDDGLWILEQSYLPSIIKNYAFDSICHEHITYFTLKQLSPLLKKYDLQIIDCTLNDMNGGSIRYFISKINSSMKIEKKNILKVIRIENNFYQNLNIKLKKFLNNIDQCKNKLSKIILKLKDESKKIHVYGASTKGNILLQYFKIDNNLIDYAADRNSFKWTKKTPGTNIPIISEKNSRKLNPDAYLVLPWHFKDEFIKREKDFLKKGGKFIFPLPKIHIF